MKIKTRVSAYTISEILVVIILSSILVLTCFSILRIIQKQSIGITNSLVVAQDISLLEKLLWNDLNTFRVTYYQDLDVLSCSSPIDSLVYRFNNSYIVRKKDTFWVSLQDKKFFLDGVSVEKGVIDAIEINILPVYGQSRIFVHKNKDASFYMNSENGI